MQPFHSEFLEEKKDPHFCLSAAGLYPGCIWRGVCAAICLGGSTAVEGWAASPAPERAPGLQDAALLPGPSLGITQAQEGLIRLSAKLLHEAGPTQ